MLDLLDMLDALDIHSILEGETYIISIQVECSGGLGSPGSLGGPGSPAGSGCAGAPAEPGSQRSRCPGRQRGAGVEPQPAGHVVGSTAAGIRKTIHHLSMCSENAWCRDNLSPALIHRNARSMANELRSAGSRPSLGPARLPTQAALTASTVA